MRIFAFALLLHCTVTVIAQPKPGYKSIFIEDKSWIEAKNLLSDSTLVLIPLGAAAKEHGPHLLLKNDWLITDYLTHRIAKEETTIIYPTINYNFYPAFIEYPGSTSIQFETSVDMAVSLCWLISRHGPKKFYILNSGVSTIIPLKMAAEKLAQIGILMMYSDPLPLIKDAELKVRQQPEGTHADEIETSMMLYMAPTTVDMSKAAREIPTDQKPGAWSPTPGGRGTYHPLGIYGDATLATREKGEVIVEWFIKGIREDIKKLRNTSVPKPITFDPAPFVGSYVDSNKKEWIIVWQDNDLWIKQPGQHDRRLFFRSPNKFVIGLFGETLFFTNSPGKIGHAYVNVLGVDYLLTRKE
jgi:creatinine amidohydrolase